VPAELVAAVQAALDDRREVLADPGVERVLIERPEALGPLLAWLEALAVVEQGSPALARSWGAGMAAAAGVLAAAGLLLLATRFSAPQLAAPQLAQPSDSTGPSLAVHDFTITITRTGPTGTTRLVNDNGRLARDGEWSPSALAQAGDLPSAIHSFSVHSSRKHAIR
jgi:hypothetical protein